MARYDSPSTRIHNRKEPYRMDKPVKPRAKNSNGPSDWKDSKKSKGVAKNTNTTVGPLKRRLRDLGRLLSKNRKLPADIKIGHEREVQALQHELVELLLEKERHEMIGKYHMVRFFERQKATRRLKSATKALASCQDNSERNDLEKQLHIAEVDLNYTQYYPYMVAYQSLWTKEKGEDGAEQYVENKQEADGAKGNVSMWREIEKAMQSRTLEKLRDSPDEEKVESIRKSVASTGSAPTVGSKTKEGQAEDGDDNEAEDETGVGFFE